MQHKFCRRVLPFGVKDTSKKVNQALSKCKGTVPSTCAKLKGEVGSLVWLEQSVPEDEWMESARSKVREILSGQCLSA